MSAHGMRQERAMEKDLRPLPDGWVYIHLPARLYAKVPDDERVTERIIRERCARLAHGSYALDRDLKRLAVNPQCEIAVLSPDYDKWFPCSGLVHDEGRRCKKHGGPGAVVVKRSYADLRRENDELRQRLTALESS